MNLNMTGYQGRLWDAPMTDDLDVIDMTGMLCVMCRETITSDDDALMQGSAFHLECLLRATMGHVAHLEGECSCFGRTEADTGGTYRESSRKVLDWLVANRRGRWASDAPYA